MAFLAVDFGGTRVRAARFDVDLNLLCRVEMPTLAQEPQQAVIDRILALASQVWQPGGEVGAVGISAPCPNAFTGIISHAAVLPGWQDVPFARIIGDAFGAPVFMQNDANLGALAEYHRGAAQGANPAMYMTISTGIGGGLVIDGQLFTGRNGLAVEPGHIKFRDPDGRIHSLEAFSAGPGIARLARLKLAESEVYSLLRGVSALTGKMVGDAALAGDALALSVIEEAGEWLGLGLVNVVHMTNPEVIVLGGSVVTGLGDLILEPARRILAQQVVDPAFYHADLIQMTQLGDDVCLIGAAAYARSQFFAPIGVE